MALRGGGGGPHHHHHGGHGGWPHGMYPPWYTQVGYPVAYQFYYGANQCPDTYCSVHDDKCVCSCSYRRPIAEGRGGGNLGAPPDYPAYGFKSPWGVPLPAEVWWAQRCPDTTCLKHKDMCGCECPMRQPKVAKASSAWDVDGLTGLGALSTFDKLLGGFAVVTIGAALLLPYVQKALKKL